MNSTRLIVALFVSTLLVLPAAHSAPPAGDFNGDGFGDLAIGVPNEAISGKNSAGAVHVLRGSDTQISSGDDQFIHQNTTGIAEAIGNDDQFAAAMAWGDFNNDGFDDLAIGAHGDNVDGVSRAGVVNVLYGSASGLVSTSDQLWHQNIGGIANAAAANDHFGYALAAGDFDGDGFDDLAVGVPGERAAGALAAGAVHIIYGSASGLSSAGDRFFTQDSSGISDAPQAGDQFGYVLAAGNFYGDEFTDLAVLRVNSRLLSGL